jgi:hypothetical protein
MLGVQVHAASKRVVISSCHECVLYLGVNHPPLLLGDNRYLQVPHMLACCCRMMHSAWQYHATQTWVI